MKIPKKGLIFFAIAGAGLVINQVSNQIKQDTGAPSYTAVGASEKQPTKIVKSDRVKKFSLAKSNVNQNHIEYSENPVDIFNEMEIFDDTNAGIYLKEHFDQLENTEPGAQERQDESMEEMRETPEVYVEKLAEAYEQVDRLNFLARYKIVYMMENIQSAHAVPFLSELAKSDLPEETVSYKGDGHIDERHQESLLRMRGVGGLHALAAEGNENARNALLNTVFETKIQTVKNDAIWAYLSTSNDIEAEKEYLKTVLPEKDHPFITVKMTNIDEVEKQLGPILENES